MDGFSRKQVGRQAMIFRQQALVQRDLILLRVFIGVVEAYGGQHMSGIFNLVLVLSPTCSIAHCAQTRPPPES